MSRIRILLVLLATVCTVALWAATEANPQAEQQALKAAEVWLALVDAGKHSESWETASALFRGAVPKEQWSQTLTAVRKPLGRVIFRKLKSRTYATTLPGAPDGEYVVIQYEASFENKKSAVETITPMLGKDGIWRVSGYYIR